MPDERLMDLARRGTLHEPETLRAEVRRMMADPRSRRSPSRSPASGCNSGGWGCSRRTGSSIPTTTNISKRAWWPRPRRSSARSWPATSRSASSSTRTGRCSTRSSPAITGSTGWRGRRCVGSPSSRATIGAGCSRRRRSSASLPTARGTGRCIAASGSWNRSTATRRRRRRRTSRPIQPTPPNQPKTSLRAKIEAHRSEPNCAACHRKIDPLGLAFDQYDAIGRWRTVEDVRDGSGANPPIDAERRTARRPQVRRRRRAEGA